VWAGNPSLTVGDRFGSTFGKHWRASRQWHLAPVAPDGGGAHTERGVAHKGRRYICYAKANNALSTGGGSDTPFVQ